MYKRVYGVEVGEEGWEGERTAEGGYDDAGGGGLSAAVLLWLRSRQSAFCIKL